MSAFVLPSDPLHTFKCAVCLWKTLNGNSAPVSSSTNSGIFLFEYRYTSLYLHTLVYIPLGQFFIFYVSLVPLGHCSPSV
jgi:hypothetical protein